MPLRALCFHETPVEISSSDEHWLTFRPVEYDELIDMALSSEIEVLEKVNVATVEDVIENIDCAHMNSSSAKIQRRNIIRSKKPVECVDIEAYSWMYKMTHVRAICPGTCQCAHPSLGL